MTCSNESGAAECDSMKLRMTLPSDAPTADEIRAAIERVGMTQVDFAGWCGVAPQTVRQWITRDENASARGAPRMLWYAIWAAIAAHQAAEDGAADGSE